MKVDIKKIGNSRGMIIPAQLLESLGLTEGNSVELKVIDGQLLVVPENTNYEMRKHSSQMQALFNLQRLGILQNPDEYEDDYIFAWEKSVYPFFDDTDGSVPQNPHECYESFFHVSKDHIDWLSKYFDDLDLEGKPFPSFYEMENELFRYTKQDLRWDRMKLIKACRYMYIRSMFTSSFDEMLKQHHPSEASWITRDV